VNYANKSNMNNEYLHMFLFKLLPLTLEELKKVANEKSTRGYKLLPPDLSFERFWDEYDYKTDKKTTETRWKGLTEGEKMAALSFIPVYNTSLIKSGLAKLYPSTYLSKKRWNDNK
jgi:hypothetical protein